MVKYRPDYSYHIIKLSQFMANPATEHYKALQDITQHILQTIDHGIYYWRDSPWTNLAEGPLPVASPDNHQFQLDPTTIINNLHGFADSDWGSCCISHNAITGAAIMLAGGDRIQNKFQKTIALSSTEAEFVSVCELGKMMLYFRSI